MKPRLLGEVSLFPRNAAGRVSIDDADHLEIGYWLRADATGQGFATEAARAALELALAVPHIERVTIHCDERNASSAAVPQRLGFQLASVVSPGWYLETKGQSRLQIWEYQ
jgi:RimJ/RimL family protein N-acetyltransferase